jgi:hypothetical protein
MAERAQHNSSKDKGSFSKGKKEAPRKSTSTVKDTAKTREAKRSKGGHREREVK